MSEWKRGKAKTLCSLNAGWFWCMANDEKFVFFCCRFQFNIFMSSSYSLVRKTSFLVQGNHMEQLKLSTRQSQIWFSVFGGRQSFFIVTLFLVGEKPLFYSCFLAHKNFTIHMKFKQER